MKIVIVTAFYSEGMGYSENSLPKAFVNLGHEVHVLTSEYNVYGNEAGYKETYETFLGASKQPIGIFEDSGYKVYRQPSKNLFGYIYIKDMFERIKAIDPDIVHVTEIASLNAFRLASLKLQFRFKLFAETHQHMSVVKPYLKNPDGNTVKKILFKLTRTLPTYIASRVVERCYAIAPDCVDVAHKFYGLPLEKIKLQPLGTDTILFSPVNSQPSIEKRRLKRSQLGYNDKDVVCIYTGRFSKDKDPLLLAQAIDKLFNEGIHIKGLFIGEGIQKDEILSYNNTQVISFMKHKDLADYYRAADIGCWPKQESMSMLDGASSGLALVVSHKIGEIERVIGNGDVYNEGDVDSLAKTLRDLYLKDDLRDLGKVGAEKMREKYSWLKVAKNIEADYINKI